MSGAAPGTMGGDGVRGGGAQPPFAAVYFDCDSTLSAMEGVDELVSELPPDLQREMRELTQQAMDGTVPLGDVYDQRLRRIAPTRVQVDAVGRLYVERAVPDARGVVAALRHLGKHVGIVSGGLLPAVLELGAHLHIDAANVHAVPVLFTADGRYRGFDHRSPLWRNGGKVEVLGAVPKDHRPLVFVGDGATDLETQGRAADLFVGFGGVAVRERVQKEAGVWLATPSLAPLLHIVLTDAERARLQQQPRFADLLQHG